MSEQDDINKRVQGLVFNILCIITAFIFLVMIVGTNCVPDSLGDEPLRIYDPSGTLLEESRSGPISDMIVTFSGGDDTMVVIPTYAVKHTQCKDAARVLREYTDKRVEETNDVERFKPVYGAIEMMGCGQ